MHTQMRPSGELLTNYVALLWVEVGQPCLRAEAGWDPKPWRSLITLLWSLCCLTPSKNVSTVLIDVQPCWVRCLCGINSLYCSIFGSLVTYTRKRFCRAVECRLRATRMWGYVSVTLQCNARKHVTSGHARVVGRRTRDTGMLYILPPIRGIWCLLKVIFSGAWTPLCSHSITHA